MRSLIAIVTSLIVIPEPAPAEFAVLELKAIDCDGTPASGLPAWAEALAGAEVVVKGFTGAEAVDKGTSGAVAPARGTELV
jgi:hypothetical protein